MVGTGQGRKSRIILYRTIYKFQWESHFYRGLCIFSKQVFFIRQLSTLKNTCTSTPAFPPGWSIPGLTRHPAKSPEFYVFWSATVHLWLPPEVVLPSSSQKGSYLSAWMN